MMQRVFGEILGPMKGKHLKKIWNQKMVIIVKSVGAKLNGSLALTASSSCLVGHVRNQYFKKRGQL
jgi:hypothetical protein